MLEHNDFFPQLNYIAIKHSNQTAILELWEKVGINFGLIISLH